MVNRTLIVTVLAALAVLAAIGYLMSAQNVHVSVTDNDVNVAPTGKIVPNSTATIVANATALIEAATPSLSSIIPDASLPVGIDPDSEPISSATYEIVIKKTDSDFIVDYSTPQKAVITAFQALYRGDREVHYNSMDRASVQIYNDVLNHGNNSFEDAVKMYGVFDKTILHGEIVYEDVTFVKFEAVSLQDPKHHYCNVRACVREDGVWKWTQIYTADKRAHKIQNELYELYAPEKIKKYNDEAKRRFEESMKKQQEQLQQENNQ